MKSKYFIPLLLIVVLILLGIGSGVLGLRNVELPKLLADLNTISISGPSVGTMPSSTRVVTEESVTINVVKKVTPAVVTIGITKNQPTIDFDRGFGFDPFDFFGGGTFPMPQNSTKQIKQDIGSGFIVRSDGLIITNKHVVSDAQAKYRVVTTDNKSFDVEKIYRDPDNDLAILKITAKGLPVVELGDSGKLQVGQFAIAIGTALGEFRSTVTTGVVSGLSRGITAGSPFEGSEKLENVIQTSAAINPGNSGGPLLNSSGQVIGVNVAVASNAQNIGFALPINLLKDSLKTFESNGAFAAKAFLGVEYRMVTRELAILNEIPEGAYVSTVVEDSPAAKAGVEEGDIITKIDGKQLRETDGGLASVISKKKPGDNAELTIYRADNETVTVNAKLTDGQQ